MGGTRVIYQENKKEASISVNNQDSSTPYLIQSWLENATPDDNRAVPFIVTPPLFRLEPEKSSVLRISYTGAPLPKDRESVFWLNIKSIAPSNPDGGNRLQVNIKSKFKLFYRPSGLEGNPLEAYKKVTFRRQGNQLIAHNPTPYFVSFYKVNVSGHEIKNPGMVPPAGDCQWTLSGGNQVSWQAINDFGGITEVARQAL
ncbi:fimbria/pilus periplasmic chaperone [Erwinia sp. CPCC 100877]|nr:fimbria/pilus periplasmic chaperone [Erwinia sp. CPCC 100877]